MIKNALTLHRCKKSWNFLAHSESKIDKQKDSLICKK